MSLAQLCLGCGFHLRTDSLADYVNSVEVTSLSSPRLAESLETKFLENGVSVDSPKNPDVRVLLSSHDFEKKASQFAPLGGMVEYEVTLTVVLTIGLPDIERESSVLSLSKTQPVKVNAEKLLSTSAEEQLVRRELIDSMADDIVRIISHQISLPSAPQESNPVEG